MAHSLPASPGRRRRNRLIIVALVVVVVAVLAVGGLVIRNHRHHSSATALTTGTSTPTTAPASTTVPTSESTPAPTTTLPATTLPTTTVPPTTPVTTTVPPTTPVVSKVDLVIANNTGRDGLAATARSRFEAGGWTVTGVGNISGGILSTCAFYDPSNPDNLAAAEALRTQFPAIKRVEPRFSRLPVAPIVVVLTTDSS